MGEVLDILERSWLSGRCRMLVTSANDGRPRESSDLGVKGEHGHYITSIWNQAATCPILS